MIPQYSEQEALLERVRMEARLIDYFEDVDHNWGRNAAFFYTEDGVFGGPEATYTGRAEIAAFYQYRIDRGVDRVAVHTVSNFRVSFQGRDRASSTWYLLSYAADGKPVLPTHAPIIIARVEDEYRLQTDGQWLCSQRMFKPLFSGGTRPTNLKVDMGLHDKL